MLFFFFFLQQWSDESESPDDTFSESDISRGVSAKQEQLDHILQEILKGKNEALLLQENELRELQENFEEQIKMLTKDKEAALEQRTFSQEQVILFD